MTAGRRFASTDPSRVLEVLPRVTVLSHLEAAFRRHLEQFPSMDNGLSRTEQQALEVIAAGVDAGQRRYVAVAPSSANRRFSWATRRSSSMSARCCVRRMPLLATERGDRATSHSTIASPYRRRPSGARAASSIACACQASIAGLAACSSPAPGRCGAGTPDAKPCGSSRPPPFDQLRNAASPCLPRGVALLSTR